jgi:hypothetical protein
MREGFFGVFAENVLSLSLRNYVALRLRENELAGQF